MKIVAEEHIPFIKEYFGSYGELVLKPGRMISAGDVKDADILLVRSITPVNESLLVNSNVKFVGSVTAGADHIDTGYLDKVGINWSLASGFNAPPVADYVVSLIAVLQRSEYLPLHRPKAAVIGVGHVGRLVVERLKALDFDVVLCDPFRAQTENEFASVSLDEIVDVDFITIHVPLTHDGEHATYHMIEKDFLMRQNLGCVLVNASRGAVIKSEDLPKYGMHLRWCFDVWEGEPNLNKTVLKESFIATPHIAGYSVQAKRRGIDMIYRVACAENIITPLVVSPPQMPDQQLAFTEGDYHWQDIVLGVFNPRVMTAMLRATLLSADECGYAFDEMRNQFHYRHEFAFTSVVDTTLSAEDKMILKRLGFRLDLTT